MRSTVREGHGLIYTKWCFIVYAAVSYIWTFWNVFNSPIQGSFEVKFTKKRTLFRFRRTPRLLREDNTSGLDGSPMCPSLVGSAVGPYVLGRPTTTNVRELSRTSGQG